MKKLIFFTLIVASLSSMNASAEEELNQESAETSAPAVTETKAGKVRAQSLSNWVASVSTLQWNEPLILKQAGKSETDVANYSGLSLGIQKEITYYHWGWSFGGFLAAGRANGGGNSTITYQKDQQAFTMIALTPRAFYRLTGRVNVGLSALAYVRNVDWPSSTAGLTVDASKNFTLTALADLNLRLSNSFDFYQGIGPLDKGATFWRIGLGYRF